MKIYYNEQPKNKTLATTCPFGMSNKNTSIGYFSNNDDITKVGSAYCRMCKYYVNGEKDYAINCKNDRQIKLRLLHEI
jgi:hypothetical protein